jgi:hypothetical protein
LARDAGGCAGPEGFSAEVGETGVMSSGVGVMAGAPFKHPQTHAPTCAKPMTNLKVLWEFIRATRTPRFSQRPRCNLHYEGMPRTMN